MRRVAGTPCRAERLELVRFRNWVCGWDQGCVACSDIRGVYVGRLDWDERREAQVEGTSTNFESMV